jgi:amino acid adenylation domain-containing protein
MSDLLTPSERAAPPRFSSVLDRLREKRRSVAPAGIGRRPRDGRGTPLSFSQQRLWFMEQLEPGTPIYNIPLAMAFSGRLEVAALAAALHQVVRRHEALRTTFRTVDGQPLQVIGPPWPVTVPVVDLAGRADADGEVRRLALADARRTFDLANGPLLRATLLRLGPERHVLLLSLHHLVGDAWSLAVLFQEFAAFYAAALEGRPGSLPELPLQYPDFALWQRDWLQGEVLERHLAAWRARLVDSPAVLNLPTDRPRPAHRSDAGRRLYFHLPGGLARRLDAVARSEGTTLFTAILAALQVLLHRWSGDEDLVVGTPVANRRRTEVQGLVGMFVNMLAMRADLGGRPTLRAFLKRTHDRVVEAQDHQDLPFEKLIEDLQPERTTSHAPLFQVALAYQNVPMPELTLPALTAEPLLFDPGVSMFDLTLNLDVRPDGMVGWWEYSTALFDEPTVALLHQRFRNLLEGLEEGIDLPLGELRLLTEAERHQTLREWNDTGEPRTDGPVCLHHLVEATARRTPEAVALIHGRESWTYRELEERAGRLAACLRGLGIGPETLVAVSLERAPDLLASLLAVHKAGGAYVPLDPAWPRDRVAFMLEDSGAPVVITSSGLAERLPATRAKRLLVDLPLEGDLPEPTPAGPGPDPGHLAYLLYTSGSTGRPKGVAVEHRSAVEMVRWAQGRYRPEELRRVLAATSVCFDISVFELFVPLSVGGAVVLAENALELPRLPAAGEITLINTVPSVLAEVMRLSPLPPGVRTVNLAGEALPGPLVEEIYRGGTVERVWNLYGPSEDTTYSTGCPVPAGEPAPPIGRPLSNSRVHLLDRDRRPVPLGSAGELCIAGAGLARGYLGRPALTAERFVPDPFAAEPGARLYRTGDLARYRPNGLLEYLGRIDHQVKVRGFRIELGEIEARLREHPAVAEAAVIVQGNDPASRRLVAYLVPREAAGDLPAVPELLAFLAERLPDFMAPSAFVTLERMPLTPSGKIDRRALPQPADAAPEAAASAPPRTPVEEVLCGIWADVLGGQPGVHDNFFALGGHSLLAPRIAARVQQAFGVDMPLRVLFDHPTVARLAAAIEEAKWQRRDEPPLVPVRRDGPLPLSFPQLRFWARRSGGGVANTPLGISLTGELDVPALHRSLAEIVRRHEVLRTNFLEVDGEPVQVVRPEARLEMPVVDLSALPPSAREPEARRLAAEEARHRFDLERELLVRATLVRLGAGQHALLLIKSHLVTDGWSEGGVADELGALYEAFSRRAPSPLLELSVQYGDFAVWQRRLLQGAVFDELLGYWLRRLDGGSFPVLPVPTDFPRPEEVDARAGRRSRRLSPELSEAVRQLGRREGASLFMTLLAAFGVLLARWTGQEDVTLTTNTANRGRAEIEGLIGLFTNVLALRADLSGDPSFREALARVRESTLEAYAHQELPFVELLQRFRPGRPEAYNELFPAGFVLQNFRLRPLAFPGLEARLLNLTSGLAPRDLILVISDQEAELETLFLYRANLFRPETIDGLLAALEAILAAAVDRPDLPLSALPGEPPRTR